MRGKFTWRNYDLMEAIIIEGKEVLDEVHYQRNGYSKEELVDLIGRLRNLFAICAETITDGTGEET